MQKEIILAGNDCVKKQKFLEYLNLEKQKTRFTVSGELKAAGASAGVLLFADPVHPQQLDELLGQLTEAAEANVQSALLLSDVRVYGKIFGKAHPVQEDEIGYVCHVRAEDEAASNLRIAEHFACRLAREDAFPIQVVRLAQTENVTDETIEAVLGLLGQGKAGEVHNLPSSAADGEICAASPLSPIPIVL